MGLMNFFSKAKTPNNQPSAVAYVDWLLLHMLRTSCTDVRIDTRRALPGSGPSEKDTPPPCIPDAQIVVNRLKILSGVNPIRQPERVGGTIELPRTQQHSAYFITQFQDDAEKSVCTIQLRIREKTV